MKWREVLADEGIAVDVVDSRRVLLSDERVSAEVIMWLHESTRPLTPSKVPALPSGPALLAVPRGTAAFVEHARSHGWSVVSDDGMLDVDLGGRRIVRRPGADEQSSGQRKASGRTGSVPWAQFSVVRAIAALAAGDGGHVRTTQQHLSRIVGASQPTVSRALRRIEAAGLIETGRSSVVVGDLSLLASWWLRNYPGPGGITGYWYGLDAPADQVRDAVRVLGVDAERIAISGEVAADVMAPWQRPQQAKVYVRAARPLTPAGLVAVPSAGAATVQVTIPDDPGVWLSAAWGVPSFGDAAEFADPLQILYDLEQSPSPTAQEAQARLLDQLRGPLAQRWANSVGVAQ
ncbi:helix-turn-helix domain-containing protein [Nocardioides sp. AE5]|uniref:helix-turn-helix domain-containing protein n=1 Tax=Nocardioides sp. AE5 TaxID=2962573 RepID=UPI002880D676|nr:helix-turn-helix domain-containing protein [Nocardioides sp. AE5]MDT0203721.1 helix-turn-helix domain-containing protein [Nocardioides sp. AE5]